MEIALTQGLRAIVSPEDEHLVLPYRWHAVKAGRTHYAARRAGTKTIYMHRLVLGVTDQKNGMHVDHIDRNGLNNTRQNLRLCTPKENAANRFYVSDYLGLRGVRQEGEKWAAQIRVDGTLIFLGSFDSEREAGIAYTAAARVIGRRTF